MGDNSGALVAVDTFQNHPILTFPNAIPGFIPITYDTWGDQDAQSPTPDAFMIFGTAAHPNHAGIIVYDDTVGTDTKIVYLALSYVAISDTVTAAELLQNIASYLMSDEIVAGLDCCEDTREIKPKPLRFEVFGGYPNPFNPTTSISYQVPAAGEVQVEVYDVRGALVRRFDEGMVGPGVHSVVFDGTNRHGWPLASGLYFFRVVYESERQTGKVLLLK
jgi:hypothetical protein